MNESRQGVRRLLMKSRKTECGAKQFLYGLLVRAAPFALGGAWRPGGNFAGAVIFWRAEPVFMEWQRESTG